LNKNEQDSPVVNLAKICRTETRTALLDYRGCGTTTAFLWLSHRYCTNPLVIEPVVLRLDAWDYARFAINEPLVSFVARQIYGTGRQSHASRQEFEEVLGKAESICLVDNLAWLSPEDQVQIGRRLAVFSGVGFTALPGISDEHLTNIDGQDTMRAMLVPFNETQIQDFIAEFAARCDSDFDIALALQYAMQEFPGSAGFPLGLSIICDQVRAHRLNGEYIVARLIEGLFDRDDQPSPHWSQELPNLLPVLRIWFKLDWRTMCR
jgi:hypothetical protein